MEKKHTIIQPEYQYFLLLLPYSSSSIIICFSINFFINRSIKLISVITYISTLLIWFFINSCLLVVIPLNWGANFGFVDHNVTLSSVREILYVYITCGVVGYFLILLQKRIFHKYASVNPEMADAFLTLADIALIKPAVFRGLPWLAGFVLCSFLGLHFQSTIILVIIALLLITGAVWPWHRMINGLFLNLGNSFTVAYKRNLVIMVGIMYLFAGFLTYMLNHP